MGAPARPQEEEWDPEYTPKSRKYYQVLGLNTHEWFRLWAGLHFKRLTSFPVSVQHDDRDREGEMKWADGRGRGRGMYPRSRGGSFTVRRGAGPSGSSGSPKWTHDMFQGATEEGELPDDGAEHSLKDEEKAPESSASKP